MHIHFLGIGGIGVSALAQYYLSRGYKVSGSDLVRTEITDLLAEKGAEILIGHGSLNAVDMLVYSAAVKEDNPELQEARKLGIKCLTYAQALGELTKQYFTIAISGSHGKSTTTAMLALILVKAGLDPTVIIGTKLKEFGNSNFRPGKSDYLVIEADEWNASFLNYWPKLIVLTNIEEEHLDYYKNLDHILKTYQEYISHLGEDGILVGNGEDENIEKISNQCQITQCKNFKKVLFSSGQKEAGELKKILKVPGEHNVKNALAALEASRALKIPDKISFQAFSEFIGAWRRFEESKAIINNQSLIIVSDYGHHPTEVKATLQAVKEKYLGKKIWVVFQPHQYQRTYYLFDNFVKIFQQAQDEFGISKLILTDIYDVAGRENTEIKEKVSAEKLIKAISRDWAVYLPYGEIGEYVKENSKDIDILLIMGAGDIYKLPESF